MKSADSAEQKDTLERIKVELCNVLAAERLILRERTSASERESGGLFTSADTSHEVECNNNNTEYGSPGERALTTLMTALDREYDVDGGNSSECEFTSISSSSGKECCTEKSDKNSGSNNVTDSTVPSQQRCSSSNNVPKCDHMQGIQNDNRDSNDDSEIPSANLPEDAAPGATCSTLWHESNHQNRSKSTPTEIVYGTEGSLSKFGGVVDSDREEGSSQQTGDIYGTRSHDTSLDSFGYVNQIEEGCKIEENQSDLKDISKCSTRNGKASQHSSGYNAKQIGEYKSIKAGNSVDHSLLDSRDKENYGAIDTEVTKSLRSVESKEISYGYEKEVEQNTEPSDNDLAENQNRVKCIKPTENATDRSNEAPLDGINPFVNDIKSTEKIQERGGTNHKETGQPTQTIPDPSKSQGGGGKLNKSSLATASPKSTWEECYGNEKDAAWLTVAAMYLKRRVLAGMMGLSVCRGRSQYCCCLCPVTDDDEQPFWLVVGSSGILKLKFFLWGWGCRIRFRFVSRGAIQPWAFYASSVAAAGSSRKLGRCVGMGIYFLIRAGGGASTNYLNPGLIAPMMRSPSKLDYHENGTQPYILHSWVQYKFMNYCTSCAYVFLSYAFCLLSFFPYL